MNTMDPLALRRSVGAASRRWRHWTVVVLCALLLPGVSPSEKTRAFSVVNISQDADRCTTIVWESTTNFVFVVFSADELSTDTVWVARAALGGLEGVTSWADTTTTNVDHRYFRVAKTDPLDDFDGDGMPNGWELQYGLNPLDPGDAHTCIVCDGTDNLTKYLQGRDPTRAAVADAGGQVRLNVFTPLE